MQTQSIAYITCNYSRAIVYLILISKRAPEILANLRACELCHPILSGMLLANKFATKTQLANQTADWNFHINPESSNPAFRAAMVPASKAHLLLRSLVHLI